MARLFFAVKIVKENEKHTRTHTWRWRSTTLWIEWGREKLPTRRSANSGWIYVIFWAQAMISNTIIAINSNNIQALVPNFVECMQQAWLLHKRHSAFKIILWCTDMYNVWIVCEWRNFYELRPTKRMFAKQLLHHHQMKTKQRKRRNRNSK